MHLLIKFYEFQQSHLKKLLIYVRYSKVGLGRAQPETRKARKPAVFGPARWPVSPRAGIILGPTRTLFFRAMSQQILVKNTLFLRNMDC